MKPEPLVSGFNIASLRLPSHIENPVKVERVLTHIPISKPKNDLFFRTIKDDAYWQTLLTIELRENNDFFVVSPVLYEALLGEPLVIPRTLVPYVTRQGELFLWPIRLPDQDGRIDGYNESAMEHAQRAQEVWMRIAANRQRASYDRWEAAGNLGEPKFPNLTADSIYEIALKNRVIADIDHPFLKKLRGEA